MIKKIQNEKSNASKITKKGGIFLLSWLAVKEHYNMYKHILRALSPFDVYECDPATYKEIERRSRILRFNDKRVRVNFGDIFNVLKKKVGRLPLYVYGHLDFCKTALTLCRDHNLLENLEKLAAWDNLKQVFFLEVTFSLWGDNSYKSDKNYGLFVLEKYIPTIFKRYGWKVENPRGHAQKHKGWKYSRSYRDGAPMINGFYKFTKI